MSLLLKHFALGNARGDIAPPCFIVAQKDMPDDEFYYEEVPGLNTTGDMTAASGCIYICKTRCGCASLWKHFFLNRCIPFLKQTAARYGLKNMNGSNMRPFLTTDGEACILEEAFDPEVKAAFREAEIDYLKLGPSATKVNQPLDGNGFRDTKAVLKMLVKDPKDIEDTYLRKMLVEFISRFKLAYQSINITTEFQEKFIYSVLLVKCSLSRAITPSKMKAMFVECGHHREGEIQDGEDSTDIERMISKCTSIHLIPHVQVQRMLDLKEQVGMHGLREGKFLISSFRNPLY